MDKSKKIFLIVAAIFLLVVIVLAVDIASKTTFPGRNSPADSTEQKINNTEVGTNN